MSKKEVFPLKLQEDALFKEFLNIFDGFVTPQEEKFKDVIEKYYGEETLPDEAIDEILKEFGLESLASLLAVSPVIDKFSVLGYAAAIAALKGQETGYFLVLDLLNFDYEATVWHEASPKNVPHTFEINVNLDASIIPNPYETFQRIKRFTGDYVLPVIDPLAYTFIVSFNEPAISLKGAQHPTYNGVAQALGNDAILFGDTNFILVDENDQAWNIFINNLGQIFSEPSNLPPVEEFLIEANDLKYIIRVSVTGDVFLEALPEDIPESLLTEDEDLLLTEDEEEITATLRSGLFVGIPVLTEGSKRILSENERPIYAYLEPSPLALLPVIDFTLVDNSKRDWLFTADANGDLITVLL